MKTFEGVATSLCTLVSPLPPFLPFHPPRSEPETPLYPRGTITRQCRQELPFCKTDHRRWHRPENIHCPYCQRKRESGGSPVCLTVAAGESWEGRCSVSPLQSPTGYKTHPGRPVHTLRGRRLCPRGCRQRRQVTVDLTCSETPPFPPSRALSRRLLGHKVPGFLLKLHEFETAAEKRAEREGGSGRAFLGEA